MFPRDGLRWPPTTASIGETLRNGAPRIDYAYGRTAVESLSPVARTTLWSFRYYSGMIIGKPGTGAEVDIVSIPKVNNFGICFDYEMRPVIAYQLNVGTCHVRYYDSATSSYVTLDLPAGVRTPRCTFDLNGATAQNSGEVIVAYFLGNDLYILRESENFAIPNHRATYLQELYLDQIGFASNNSLRFIVYQLVDPAVVGTTEPVPISKYSIFTFPRTKEMLPPQYWPYDAGELPTIDPAKVEFVNDGLDSYVTVTDLQVDSSIADTARYVPTAFGIRKEWWEEVTDPNTPMFEVSVDGNQTTYTKGMLDGTGMVWSPLKELYLILNTDLVYQGYYNGKTTVLEFRTSKTNEVTRVVQTTLITEPVNPTT